MTGKARKQRLLLACLALFTAGAAGAETFTHRNQAENFEAVVTADQLVVKERYQGATTIYGDLTCPLGPAVTAVALPLASDGRLCLQFAKDKCRYTRFQNGEPIHAEELKASKPRMCIALASAQDAQKFAALVNAGPQPAQVPAIGSTGSIAAQAPPIAESGVSNGAKNDAGAAAERAVSAKPPQVPPVARVDVTPAKSTVPLPPVPQAEPDSKPAVSAPPPRQAQPVKRDEDERRAAPSRSPAEAQTSPALSAGKSQTAPRTDAPSGKWITESFVVGPEGSRRMSERTYATAFVGQNAPGKPPGEYLYIRNKSDKHLLFYSLGDGPQLRLEPGNQAVLALALYGSGSPNDKHKSVTLLWFDAAKGSGTRWR
jgi:hypothetical protein